MATEGTISRGAQGRSASGSESGKPATVTSTGLPHGVSGQQLKRRAAAIAALNRRDTPHSTRAAGAGGSSSTMMRLYTTDDSPGVKIDPVIVLALAVLFIFSVVALHLITRLAKWYLK